MGGFLRGNTSARLRPGVTEILLCTLAWGTIGPLAKQLTLPSRVIVFFRLALGFVVVFGWLAARGELALVKPRARARLLITSGVVLAVHWAALFEAYRRLSVTTTILIVFLGPVLMAVAAPRVLGEHLRARSIVALVVAFGGIVLIAGPRIAEVDGVGLVFAFVSAALFAVLMLMGKFFIVQYEPVAITFWQLGIAAIVMSPGLVGARADQIMHAAPGLLLLGGVFSGALGIVFFRAMRALQAQELGVLFYLEPTAAVLYSWLLLAERPSATTLAGGGLIIAAGLGIILGDRRSPVTARPEARP